MNETVAIAQLVGPRGGNLNNPANSPERRKSEFKGDPVSQLHRFEKADIATMGLKNEKAWHRMAGYMLIAGRTNSEIAMAAGVTPQQVSILRAQVWFQQLLATLANNEGEELVGILRSETQASINKIVELRDFSDSHRIQLTAAQILLEQAHGKPTQKILSHNTQHTSLSPLEEMDEINQELAAMRKQ